MESISNILARAGSYLTTIGIADFFDILLVAYLIYRLIWFIRKTNFVNFAKGLFLYLVALWASGFFRLIMINYILRKGAELGLIALVILFQPELRRIFERVGSSIHTNHGADRTLMARTLTQTVQACSDMSASRTGALLVFERNVSLSSFIGTGSVINADANAELIKNLFYNKAPLHDGAVILRDGRIEAAGCVLPLSQTRNLSRDLGTRHRAAIGLSEETDAVVVIVSEETGSISVAVDGELKRHLSATELSKVLSEELIREDNRQDRHEVLAMIKNFFRGNEKDDEDETEKTI